MYIRYIQRNRKPGKGRDRNLNNRRKSSAEQNSYQKLIRSDLKSPLNALLVGNQTPF